MDGTKRLTLLRIRAQGNKGNTLKKRLDLGLHA